jgi:hypothetical protein
LFEINQSSSVFALRASTKELVNTKRFSIDFFLKIRFNFQILKLQSTKYFLSFASSVAVHAVTTDDKLRTSNVQK